MNKLFKNPYIIAPAAFALLLLLLIGPTIAFNIMTKNERPQSLSAVETNEVGIVFGSGLRPSGEVSSFLADRLDSAIELYGQNKISHIIVSGDNRTVDHNEPAAMSAYLEGSGIPLEDIT